MSSILLCGLRACSKIMESILRSALKAPFWYTMIILKLKAKGYSLLPFAADEPFLFFLPYLTVKSARTLSIQIIKKLLPHFFSVK